MLKSREITNGTLVIICPGNGMAFFTESLAVVFKLSGLDTGLIVVGTTMRPDH